MSSLTSSLDVDTPCLACGFELWEPIVTSTHGKLGLYNDDRFPGRCILAFPQHVDSLESLPMDSMLGFLRDIQVAMKAIRLATGARRVNVSILGNRDPHLHAHLVPRWPEREARPDCSPWDDPREKGMLSADRVEELKDAIRSSVRGVDTRGQRVGDLLPYFEV
ncbi:HIT family protein [Microbacterium sp. NPDC089695]|uniref:HIT family protein n=1 Tax=Microbacterium sp. NPDC089695 TaxID=3364198 RepID=UPI003816BFF2